MVEPRKKLSSRTPLVSAVSNAGLNESHLKSLTYWLSEQLTAYEHAKLGQGGHTNTQIPLKQVFVDLPVNESRGFERSVRGEKHLFLKNFLGTGAASLKDLRDRRAKFVNKLTSLLHQSGSKKSSFSCALLVGGPGQGKSTLGQIACQLHRASLLKTHMAALSTAKRELVESFLPSEGNAPDEKAHQVSGILLPLQISLPELAIWLAAEGTTDRIHPPSLIRFVASLESARQCDLSANVLAAIAIQIPVLLVLDGFDEVGSAADRERIIGAANEMLDFLANYDNSAKIIATTRPQGYTGEFDNLIVELSTYYLLPLEKKEALTYAEKLVTQKISGLDERAVVLSRLLAAAEEPATERLMTTPLQVTILAALVQHRGRAPRERWNLFWSYFTFTFTREIERETFASEVLRVFRHHIEQIHARVGLLLQVETEREGGGSVRLTQARLEEIIVAVLGDAGYEDGYERDGLVKDIVEAAKLRLVFIVEPEPGSFGFEIRSLQEFMCAWALTTGRDSHVEERLVAIARSSTYRNVFLFATSRLFSEGSHLCEALWRRICPSLDEDQSDRSAVLIKAGAVLALETLEEGAAHTHPKYAKELIVRAAQLLAIRPSEDLLRLVNTTSGSTRKALIGILETALFEGDDSECCSDSVWVTLIALIAIDEKDAISVAATHEALLTKVLTSVVSEVARLGVVNNYWLKSIILKNSSLISPSALVNFKEKPYSVLEDWFQVLHRAYSNLQWRLRSAAFDVFPIRSISDVNIIDESSLPPIPETWKAWCKAAIFELNPNPVTLVHAIESSRNENDIYQILWRSSWPYVVSIKADEASKARTCLLLKDGTLGSQNDWRSAEARWKDSSQWVLKNSQESGAPWDINSPTPPITIMNPWDLASRVSNSSKPLILQLNKIFELSNNEYLTQWAARACIYTLARANEDTHVPVESIKRWITAEPGLISVIIPKPQMLSDLDWAELINTAPEANHLYHISDPSNMLEDISPSFVSVRVLDIIARNIDNHQAASENQRLRASSGLAVLPKSVRHSLPGLIIKLAYDRLDYREADMLISGIRDLESGRREIYTASSLRALTSGKTSLSTALSILDRFAGFASGRGYERLLFAARTIFQRHQARIDNQTVWDRLALPMPRPAQSKAHVQQEEVSNSGLKLRQLELKNVCGIENLTLSFDLGKEGHGQWIVFIGPNGVGKSTLLRSLALALRDCNDPSIWPNNSLSRDWIRRAGTNESAISEASITVTTDTDERIVTKIRCGDATTFIQDEDSISHHYQIYGYGCRRSSQSGNSKLSTSLGPKDGAAIATLFDTDAVVTDVESWLIRLDGDRQKDPLSELIYQAVIGALKNLLSIEDISIHSQRMWVKEFDKCFANLSCLSDGYFTSMTWIVDMIARWTETARRQSIRFGDNFLAEMTGVVLIDELDLHLHPQWQLEVINRMRTSFPKMTFFATTHNPLTLIGARSSEIHVLEYEEGKVVEKFGIDSPSLMSGSQLYADYFGIRDFYPKEVGKKVHRYSFLSRFSLRDDAEEMELEELGIQLTELNVLPPWPVTPRKAIV